MICVYTPEPFYGVGAWYQDFAPTSDEEVRQLLQLSREQAGNAAAALDRTGAEQSAFAAPDADVFEQPSV